MNIFNPKRFLLAIGIFVLVLAQVSITGAFWAENAKSKNQNAEKGHCGGTGRALIASWYSRASLIKEGTWDRTHGRCADGSYFNDNNFTCASWDYPLGTWVCVTNISSGNSVIVRVSDRTARRFKGKRIDLSRLAFSKLDKLEKGLISVKVEVLK